MNDKNKYIDEMINYYDVRAPWHDDYMSFTSNEQMENRQKPIIDIFEKELFGKKVLEIACGTGNWTEVLAKRANEVTAIDSSSQSLYLAQTKLADYKNIKFIETDIFDSEKITSEYDLIFSADWFSHIPIELIPDFIKLVQSKLSANAQLITVDMSTNEYFENENNYFDENGNRVSTRELPNGEQFHVIKNFFTEKRLREFFSAFDNFSYFEFDQLQRWMTISSNKK